MCGRYASSANPHDLAAYFAIEEPPEEVLAPSYNVAPTDPVYVVMKRHHVRRLAVVRWGLVPSWAKDPRGAARFINARQESVREKPAFRAAFARRRCLVPADGYYEWQNEAGRKQPYFLFARDGQPLAMAGLYEVWRAPVTAAEDTPLLWTCTVLTTEAADDLGHIHDRTPLLVPPDRWEHWLDPAVEDPGDDLLVPATPGRLDARAVSTRVGNVRNNDAQLLEPLPAE